MRYRGPLCSVLLLVAFLAAADDPAERAVELDRLRQQIERLKDEQHADLERRDELGARLRDAEMEAARARGALEQARQRRAASERRLGELEADLRRVEAALARERASLAAALRTAYVNGREERLKLLLNQQDPARLGRLMVYYGYFGRQRVERIHAVDSRLDELAALGVELEAERTRLAAVEAERRRELEAIEAARAERSRILAALETGITARGAEVSRLEREAVTLARLIERLQRTLARFPIQAEQPFADWKGRLPWPVEGVLLSDYGEPRAQGRLRWNGVLLGTERGSEVRAIYHGRVAYADWLPGLGLLLVIEHDHGYLSLYGHNEVLYKEAGDWVAPGDVIARVGDTGGRSRPALYFEIRQGTRPLDPHQWIRTRLTRR